MRGRLWRGAAAAAACGGVAAAGGWLLDGHTVPRSAFHMTVATRILDEREHVLRFFSGFVSSLSLQRRVPNVVVEALTPETFSREENKADSAEGSGGTASAERSACQFTEQHAALSPLFAARLDDYRGSGYTRGHMAAAGNFKHASQEAMCDTFVLGANIVPQEGRNNADYWFRLELLARRDLPQLLGTVYVLSGPLFLPHAVAEDPDKGISRHRRGGSKQYVTHEVVGSGVSVPTHLFKAFVVLRDSGPPLMSAYVVPNRPVRNTPLSQLAVSRDELARLAGFRILPKEANVAPLCGEAADCDGLMMTDKQYRTYLLGRQLGWAKTADELEKTWSKAARKGVEVDSFARDLYERRMRQLGTPRQQAAGVQRNA